MFILTCFPSLSEMKTGQLEIKVLVNEIVSNRVSEMLLLEGDDSYLKSLTKDYF